MSFAPTERRQFVWITLGALAVFVVMRLLPARTNLSHMDFRVDPRGGNALEFCDPLNPQFIPVVAARSPVTMRISAPASPRVGAEVLAVVTLTTASGKPIVPGDLLVTHTRRLHLLIIDPALGDYQHVHPEAGREAGEWAFAFTPRRSGTYRIFADFTPVATARGLYTGADVVVSLAGAKEYALTDERRGPSDMRFALTTSPDVPRAGQPIDLRFTITRKDGGEVPLEPVMGAFAHLVAFDEARSGFAHLHPTEADLLKKPDAAKPVLNFKLTIPRAGRYVIWAQVNLGAREEFVPFEFPVKD